MSYPNPEQQAILDHRTGALLVMAPAGTGKTRVMADRLAAAIEAGVGPDETLAVTFTNRAAEEMRRAVRCRCETAAKDCRIQTFHGLCAWILRREARDLGLPADFVIYDEQDSIDVLRTTLGQVDEKPEEVFWLLSQLKSDCPRDRLTLDEIPDLRPPSAKAMLEDCFRAYHQILAERHALDFSDLIFRTRAMFALMPAKRAKWAARFRWIQIDEVQDTHLSEYEVIRVLATPPADIAFFGDLDQTIYEWRGSNPTEVTGRIKSDFSPVAELPLVHNYRSTKALLRTADRHAASFEVRLTRNYPAPSLDDGELPVIHQAADSRDESEWIAARVAGLRGDPGCGRIGILARTHNRTKAISEALANRGIPHLTVEQFEFFRRQEVKDLLARLRLLLNPADTGSLLRVVQRPASGIGPATLRALWNDGAPCGLRVTDLLDPRHGGSPEPFHPLLAALEAGEVVVFDVETTGLDPRVDEVIDLGAVKLRDGKPVERFDALLRPTRPPGDTEAVHGIDEATLRRHGRDPAEVFREFACFAGNAVLVGHNIRFDLAMVRAHTGRLGVGTPAGASFDTHDIARRLLDLERYHLDGVCAHLGTAARPSHRALADAEATAEALVMLNPRLAGGAAGRRALCDRHRKLFGPLARLMDGWLRSAASVRPAELCGAILSESGLRDHYRSEPHRLANLERLVGYFALHDDPRQTPERSLDDLTCRVSLARNLDHLDPGNDDIPILTVHQSKGLEFDSVFVAGLTDDEFPSYYAKRDRRTEEEKRLFYVALTRAKRRLFLSCHHMSDGGWQKGPSPFLRRLL